MTTSDYARVVAPRIVLHFHPGWGFGEGTVLDAIAASGAYRSQWETGTSNGGLTAYPDGDRWRWESRIFDRRYDRAVASDRPVYGAWNRRDDPYGASPRFGSAYFRLRPEVIECATFCWPDSVYDPRAVGGPDRLDELCRLVDAGLLDPTLLPGSAADLPLNDPLNDYVEAHVHGTLIISRDVEALVLDPTDLQAHSKVFGRLGCPTEEHPGYRLTAEAIDPGYRSHVPVELARTLGARLTPSNWPQPPGRAATIPRRSNGCGTVWPGSADRARTIGVTSLQPQDRQIAMSRNRNL